MCDTVHWHWTSDILPGGSDPVTHWPTARSLLRAPLGRWERQLNNCLTGLCYLDQLFDGFLVQCEPCNLIAVHVVIGYTLSGVVSVVRWSLGSG